ncbi:hypothetical protein, partial [Escherichia coli]|uniref:hypothetical protein n=1 Tax=Escherichia coli TaxID=562 RepID=UPI003CEAC48D
NPVHAIILVIVSTILTMLGGHLPARMAAKKDAAIALRASKQYLEERKFSKMQWINFISVFFVAMQAFIPMVILVAFGQVAIE